MKRGHSDRILFDLIVLRHSQDSNVGMGIEKAINGRYFWLNLPQCFKSGFDLTIFYEALH